MKVKKFEKRLDEFISALFKALRKESKERDVSENEWKELGITMEFVSYAKRMNREIEDLKAEVRCLKEKAGV